jgi:hypothetical protein
MPLTEKGSEILANMEKEYGAEKGEQVFYASRNKGTISGVDEKSDDCEAMITISPREGEFLTLPMADEKESAKHITPDPDQPKPYTELDMARDMRDGKVASPQKLGEMHLFDMRITGTGHSFREALSEHVIRPPENYLTQDFLDRCNGLPVIFEHPDGKGLDTKEFRDRSAGSILLPYIKGDEVWGIARIHDADVADLMRSTHTSTSPAVVFRRGDGNKTLQADQVNELVGEPLLEKGEHLLIEGIPSYLDHLAICREGVWDKDNGPSGINLGDDKMPETDKEVIEKGIKENTEGKEIKDRKDSEMPAWADSLHKKFDSLSERMDKYDSRKDSEEKDLKKAEEAHKKEGEDLKKAEEEKAKKDAAEAEKKREEDGKADARMDSVLKVVDQLKAENAQLKSRFDTAFRELSPSERDELALAQSRYDSLAQRFGEAAPAPLAGEGPIAYQKRLAARYQKYSPKCKDIRLDSLDAPSFGIVQDQIIADSVAASNSPAFMPEGALVPYFEDEYSSSGAKTGRKITKWRGSIKDFLAPFTMKPRRAKLNTDRRNR